MPRIFASTGLDKTLQTEARYANIYVADGAAAQGSIDTTPVKVTGFAANGSSNDATPDHTDDSITIGTTGTYKVDFQISFSGTVSTGFEFHLRVNAAEQAEAGCHRLLGAGGDVGSAGFSQIMALASGDVVTIYVEATLGSSKAITPVDMQLSVFEIAPAVTSGNGVLGPGSATDNAAVRFDGTSGTIIQGSAVIIDDSDNITGVNDFSMGGNFVGGTFASATTTINGGTITT